MSAPTPKHVVYLGLGLYPLLIATAELLAPADFDWTRYTISRLSGQGFPNAWLVRAAFVELGLTACLAAWIIGRGMPGPIRRWIVTVAVAHYGLALALCGVFSERAWGAETANHEARTHIVCAQGAGVSLVFAIVFVIFAARDRFVRWFSFATWVTSGLLVSGFYNDPEWRGVWLRGLHLGALLWLATLTYRARHSVAPERVRGQHG